MRNEGHLCVRETITQITYPTLEYEGTSLTRKEVEVLRPTLGEGTNENVLGCQSQNSQVF